MALIGDMQYLTIGSKTYRIASSSLPIASASTLGGIKVGTGLTIDNTTGVLSATGTSVTIDNALSDTSTNPVQNKVIKTALDNKADSTDIPTKTSDLTNDSNFMSGMTILSYGKSTWNDFITAYRANHVVYCRASSNANPASGSQTRMAFMAYVSDATNPTNVEFQYYRSVSSHSASQQGDQVYVYKLTNGNAWTVTVREASVKININANNSGIKTTYSSGTVSIGHTNSVTAKTTQAVYPITIDAQGHIDSIGTAATLVNDVQYNSTSKEITISKNGSMSTVVELASVATSGDYDDLLNKPTIPAKTSLTVSLVVANWSSNTQTVTATGVTASNDVIVAPAPSSMDDYVAAGIKCTAQAANSLTFTCSTVPTNAITVNVMILS